jgi:hypothetical protein
MGYDYTLKIDVQDYDKNKASRIIRIAGSESLDDLCEAIMFAFSFIHEHSYEYLMDNNIPSDKNYTSFDDDRPSTNVPIDSLHLKKGQVITLHYDFGDDWMFKIKVKKIYKTDYLHPWFIVDGRGFVLQYPPSEIDDEEGETAEIVKETASVDS